MPDEKMPDETFVSPYLSLDTCLMKNSPLDTWKNSEPELHERLWAASEESSETEDSEENDDEASPSTNGDQDQSGNKT